MTRPFTTALQSPLWRTITRHLYSSLLFPSTLSSHCPCIPLVAFLSHHISLQEVSFAISFLNFSVFLLMCIYFLSNLFLTFKSHTSCCCCCCCCSLGCQAEQPPPPEIGHGLDRVFPQGHHVVLLMLVCGCVGDLWEYGVLGRAEEDEIQWFTLRTHPHTRKGGGTVV